MGLSVCKGSFSFPHPLLCLFKHSEEEEGLRSSLEAPALRSVGPLLILCYFPDKVRTHSRASSVLLQHLGPSTSQRTDTRIQCL